MYSKRCSKRDKFIEESETTHHSSATINTPIKLPPTRRSASGQSKRPRRQLRAPDAPKIKHDKVKQFYMIDMERKRW